MDFDDTLTIAAPPEKRRRRQLSMRYFRGLFHWITSFHFILVLSCALFGVATCGPCWMDGMQKLAEYDSCGLYGNNLGVGFQDFFVTDSSGSSITRITLETICTDSHSFCFLSTLPGFWYEEYKLKETALEVPLSESDGPLPVGSAHSRWAGNKSWSSDNGMFELLNGGIVACSLNSRDVVNELTSMQTSGANQNDLSSCRGPLLTQKSTSFRMSKNTEIKKSCSFDVSSSPQMVISPPELDWGQKNLYSPSIAFLTVANTCNDSILHVYEPFSTNVQFFPCNFSEILLGPGEVASICFVFLPRWLGFSSAHLILQTSSGGFLVQVKGYAVESPYEVSPLVSLDVLSSGWLSKNLSLSNPFNETLYIKEVSAWLSITQGNTSHHTEATCSLGNFEDIDKLSVLNLKDWLVVKSGQLGFPLMAIKPHTNWEIGPQSSGTIIEIDFSSESEGKIVGAFCMQLLSSLRDKSDIVMIPLEIDLNRTAVHDGVAGSLSVSLKALVPSGASNPVVVAVSLRNGFPRVLSIVNISEVAAMKFFNLKYIEGLLLFPGTVTQVAIITCTEQLVELLDPAPGVSNEIKNCQIVVLTNDSTSPQIVIPCPEVIQICLSHRKDSTIGYDRRSENAEFSSRRAGSSCSSMQMPSQIKAMETVEADEFILGNWKSQGTTSGMSVLDDHEVLFPVVQVGTYCSKWITVKNPSEQPVVMQLILNPGEIIDECRGTDALIEPLLSSSFIYTGFTLPARNGFSMAENALTEAFVHPYGKASFGPIVFHPSNRCNWRSSALIRNNLSGVEWLSLRGFGGSFSLVLLEGSERVQIIEFNLNLPISINISLPEVLFNLEETAYACFQPLSKELYAKNMGELPLEVKSIEVSGSACGLDGYKVHTCEGFTLEPGESTKLLISYQSDFSTDMVHQNLELSLASGVLVIPMKASLPLYMFNLCKKSVFWMRVKKLAVVIFFAASALFLMFSCIFPQVIALGSQDYFCKRKKRYVTTVRSAGKSPRSHRCRRNSKSLMPTQMDGPLASVGEDRNLKQESVDGDPDSQDGASEIYQNVERSVENHKQVSILSYPETDTVVPSLLSKSVSFEDPDALEACPPHNLTVRIGKEKGRRRRRKKGVNAGLAGLFEISSSQSGNSTPSSPLSPVASAMANRAWSLSPDVDNIEARNPFTQVADQPCISAQVSEPASKAIALEPKISFKCSSNNGSAATQEQSSWPRTSVNAVSSPSAISPCAGRAASNVPYSSLASTSTISPNARAPGPKLYDRNSVEEEKKVGKEYTYDIWGNHFSGLHLMGNSKDDVTTMKNRGTEYDSNSFFVRGPQALMPKSRPKSASFLQHQG